MNFTAIKKDIEKLEQYITTFENINNDNIENKSKLSVIEFNNMMENLKNKNLKSQNESSFFKRVFNDEDYYESISSYLQQIQILLRHKMKKNGVDPNINKNLKQSLEFIEETMDLLVVEYGNSSKKGYKNTAKHKNKIKETLVALVDLKEKLNKIVYNDSKIVSNVVLNEFESIFSLFSNCIKVAKNRSDELLLVEVASLSDKIMNMIEPVFVNKSLNPDELIYYYLFYELKELKTSAVSVDVKSL
ncbi:hypothetical protein [Campylobacter pinnipediorum]|uniref:hypothetical protein n=1 Tax=Campylobacter pinnipediorum TaxID=1965231 RepID=UPI000994E99D|nr:hypothetical protein [Campylobacter pinnipediorum]AQW82542.1 hypothetical protein CPIN17261_0520 [Campylobacter pinnipediorum subsp. pinnipediorum]